jgi:hypothetical protein
MSILAGLFYLFLLAFVQVSNFIHDYQSECSYAINIALGLLIYITATRLKRRLARNGGIRIAE